MNPELEELLAAEKVMFTENTVEEAGRLHKAITAFEAARAVKGSDYYRGYTDAIQWATDKLSAPDPYDFENKGLRMKP